MSSKAAKRRQEFAKRDAARKQKERDAAAELQARMAPPPPPPPPPDPPLSPPRPPDPQQHEQHEQRNYRRPQLRSRWALAAFSMALLGGLPPSVRD